MPDASRTWTATFHVRAYEVGPAGRVPIHTLCNYLQEAAGNHASALGISVEQLLERNLTWFLGRLHLEIESWPVHRSAVHVETWPSGEEGLFATRDYELRTAEGAPIGRGTTAWLVVDVQRRRPVRIPPSISSVLDPPRPPAVTPAADRLSYPDAPSLEQVIRVRREDVDVNGHANNVHYAAWVIEALPPEVSESRRLSSLEIQFKAETSAGDVIISQARESGDGLYVHRLLRKADGREVALARTRWR